MKRSARSTVTLRQTEDVDMELRDSEKLILFMLCEIYERVSIKDSVDPALVKEAIHSGNTWALKSQYPGIFDASESKQSVITEVNNYLGMWSYLERGFGALTPAEKKRVEKEVKPFEVRFRGFDGNSESQYTNAANFMIDYLDRSAEFNDRDLNSHMPLVEAYRRMYALFEPMRGSLAGRNLDGAEIIKIIKAMAHP